MLRFCTCADVKTATLAVPNDCNWLLVSADTLSVAIARTCVLLSTAVWLVVKPCNCAAENAVICAALIPLNLLVVTAAICVADQLTTWLVESLSILVVVRA